MESSNVNGEREKTGVGRVEEISIFDKMNEILHSVTERQGSRGENEALECFLKF
jgi:hypothetical protein